MRADRLVALLLILQRRGHVTAGEVAAELEISERTARRDLEALGTAGLPIYSTQGRNGGWQLLGGARTDLSGLNAAEARALFLVAGPASSVTPAVKAGLRKLLRALPETMRDEAETAAGSLVVDSTRWGHQSDERSAPRYLDVLQTAVITGEQVTLGYQSPRSEPSLRVVHPLGIAAKGPQWYLVADTDVGLRTFRVDRVLSVDGTGVAVVRPQGFELAAAWKLIAERFDERWLISVRALAEPSAVAALRWVFGTKLRLGPAAADGRIEVELASNGERALVGQIAGFGSLVEVIGPADVRSALARIGAQLTQLYDDEPG